MADLNRLIDEVLSMAKDSQSIRKKKRLDDETAQVNQSWDDTPAGQAYWKDIRGRNTALEVGKMQNAAAMDLAKENNAGQMARQALMEDTKRADDVRNYNLNLYKEKVNENVGRFNAQTLRQAAMTKQETAGSKEDPRAALFAALSQPGMTDEEAVRIKKMFDSIYGQPTAPPPAGEQRPTAKPADIHSAKYINDNPAREFAKETTKDSSLIGRTRADSPDDYNIFGTKKQPYFSDFIDHSGPAQAPLRKKKIADMNENEVIAEQNLYNKKYGVNIGGKIFTLPFTPASPMDKWRKSKYGE
jgi:hypothetical protein